MPEFNFEDFNKKTGGLFAPPSGNNTPPTNTSNVSSDRNPDDGGGQDSLLSQAIQKLGDPLGLRGNKPVTSERNPYALDPNDYIEKPFQFKWADWFSGIREDEQKQIFENVQSGKWSQAEADYAKKVMGHDLPEQSMGTPNGYYTMPDDPKQLPHPLKYGEKPPKNAEMSSIWGSQREAEDDNPFTTLLKSTMNTVMDIGTLPFNLLATAEQAITGQRGAMTEMAINETNALHHMQFHTRYSANESILNNNFKGIADFLKSESYNLTPQNVANLAGNVAGSVIQFIGAGSFMGGAEKAVKAGEEGLALAEGVEETDAARKVLSGAEKAKKAKEYAAAVAVNFNESYRAAQDANLKPRDAAAMSTVVALGMGFLENFIGGPKMRMITGAKESGVYKEVSDLAAKAFSKSGGEIDEALVKEVFNGTIETASPVLKAIKEGLKDIGTEATEETVQEVYQRSMEQLHDTLNDYHEGQGYGTDVFSAESMKAYFENGLGGMLGGVMGHARESINGEVKQRVKEEQAYNFIKDGKAAQLQNEIYNLYKRGEVSPQDLFHAGTLIKTYQNYFDAVKDHPDLDDTQKLHVFRNTMAAEGLHSQIETMKAGPDTSEMNEDQLAAYDAKKTPEEKIQYFNQQFPDKKVKPAPITQAEIKVLGAKKKEHEKAIEEALMGKKEEVKPEIPSQPSTKTATIITPEPAKKRTFSSALPGEETKTTATPESVVTPEAVKEHKDIEIPEEHLDDLRKAADYVVSKSLESKPDYQAIDMGEYKNVEYVAGKHTVPDEVKEARKDVRIGDVLDIKPIFPEEGKKLKFEGASKEYDHALRVMNPEGVELGGVQYQKGTPQFKSSFEKKILEEFEKGNQPKAVVTGRDASGQILYKLITNKPKIETGKELSAQAKAKFEKLGLTPEVQAKMTDAEKESAKTATSPEDVKEIKQKYEEKKSTTEPKPKRSFTSRAIDSIDEHLKKFDNNGNLLALPPGINLLPGIYKGSLLAARGALVAGQAIGKAVQHAIDYVKKEAAELWAKLTGDQRKDMADHYREVFGEEKEPVETTPEERKAKEKELKEKLKNLTGYDENEVDQLMEQLSSAQFEKDTFGENKKRIRKIYADWARENGIPENKVFNAIKQYVDENKIDYETIQGQFGSITVSHEKKTHLLGEHLAKFPPGTLVSMGVFFRDSNPIKFLHYGNYGGKGYKLKLSNMVEFKKEVIEEMEQAYQQHIKENDIATKYPAMLSEYQAKRAHILSQIKQFQKNGNDTVAALSQSIKNKYQEPQSEERDQKIQKLKDRLAPMLANANFRKAVKEFYDNDFKFMESVTGIPASNWEAFTDFNTKEIRTKFGVEQYADKYQYLFKALNFPDPRTPIQNYITDKNKTFNEFNKNIFAEKGKTQIMSVAKALQQQGGLELHPIWDNVAGEKKSSIVQRSPLYTDVERLSSAEIQNNDRFKNNRFVQFFKDHTPELFMFDGLKEMSEREAVSAEDMTEKDLALAMLTDFVGAEDHAGKGNYLHRIEVMSDKKQQVAIAAPKYTLSKAREIAPEILGNEISLPEIKLEANEWSKKIDQFVQEGIFEMPAGMNSAELGLQFAYNYAINKAEADSYFQGNASNMKDGKYVNQVKRQNLSNGLSPDITVPGGIGNYSDKDGEKGVIRHLTIADPVMDLKIGKELFKDAEPGDGFTFASEDFSGRLNKSYGSVFDYKNILKYFYSKINPKGDRTLLKTNAIVLSKEFAEKHSVLKQIWQDMKDHNIELVTFKSGAKIVDKKWIVKPKYGKDGGLETSIMDGIKDPESVIQKLDAETPGYFVMQQDLRQPGILKDGDITRQLLRITQQFKNSEKIQSLFNQATDLRVKQFTDAFEKMDQKDMRDFFVENIADTEDNDYILSLLLDTKINMDHPFMMPFLQKVFGSIVEKEVLGIKVNKGVATEMPGWGTDLKEDEVYLPSGYAKQLTEGDKVFITRVPSTENHSTSMLKVKGFLPEGMGSTLITHPVVQKISGSDNDGDARHIWAPYKDKSGKVIELTDENKQDHRAVTNEAFRLLQQEYEKPENQDNLIKPIDTNAFDPYIKKYMAQQEGLNKLKASSFLSMFQANMEGKAVIGIDARAMAVVSQLRKHLAEFKDPISFPGVDGNITIKGFPKDFNINMLIANATNLATDNAKEQKLVHIVNMKPTATMFMGLLATGVDPESLISFFHHPVVQDYIKEAQEAASPTYQYDPNKIFDRLAERYVPESTLPEKIFNIPVYKKNVTLSKEEVASTRGNDKLSVLMKLQYLDYAFKDFQTISQAISDTENGYGSYADLYAAKQNFMKLLGNNMKIVTPEPISGSPYFKAAEHNRKISDMFYAHHMMNSDKAVAIRNKLAENIAKLEGKKDKKGNLIIRALTKKQIETLDNAIRNYTTIQAAAKHMTREDAKTKAVRAMQSAPDAIKEYLQIDAKSGNVMMKPRYQRAKIDLATLDNIHKAMESIPDANRKALLFHQMYEYGFSTSSKSGGYATLLDQKVQQYVSKQMEKIRYDWMGENDAYEIAEQIALNNPELLPRVSLTELNDKLYIKSSDGHTVNQADYPRYVLSSYSGKPVIYRLMANPSKTSFHYLAESKSNKAVKVNSKPDYEVVGDKAISKTSGILADLHTWDQGNYEGLQEDLVKEEMRKYVTDTPDKKMPGSGESFNEMKDRIINLVRNQIATAQDGTLLFTHSGILKVIDAWQKAGSKADNSIDIKSYLNADISGGARMEIETKKGKLYLQRHPRTSENKGGGTPTLVRTKDSQLSESGRAEALQIADELKDLGITRILSSPYIRALQGAQIIADELNLEGPMNTAKFQTVSDEAPAESNPKLQEAIRDRLAKLYPGVEVFKNADAFQEFVTRNFGDQLDLNVMGAAFKNAVFINPDSAVQSTQIHEHAHLYWDALPTSDPLKKLILKAFNGNEEEAITAIGKAGTSIAEIELPNTNLARFKSLLKTFWAKVKKLFRVASGDDLATLMADRILNNTDELEWQDMFNTAAKFMAPRVLGDTDKSIAGLTEMLKDKDLKDANGADVHELTSRTLPQKEGESFWDVEHRDIRTEDAVKTDPESDDWKGRDIDQYSTLLLGKSYTEHQREARKNPERKANLEYIEKRYEKYKLDLAEANRLRAKFPTQESLFAITPAELNKQIKEIDKMDPQASIVLIEVFKQALFDMTVAHGVRKENSEKFNQNDSKKWTKALYAIAIGETSDDFHSLFDGAFGKNVVMPYLSPQHVRQKELQVRQHLVNNVDHEVIAQVHDEKATIDKLRAKVKETGADLNKLRDKDYPGHYIGKFSDQWHKIKRSSDAGDKVLFELIDNIYAFEKEHGNMNINPDNGRLKMHQVEMDTPEMIRAMGIQETMTHKLVGDQTYDSVHVKTKDMGKDMGIVTLGDAKEKLLKDAGKSKLSTAIAIARIKRLEMQVKKMLAVPGHPVDAKGLYIRNDHAKEVSMGVSMEPSKYATGKYLDTMVQYREAVIRKELLEQHRPILDWFRDYYGRSNKQNIVKWLEMQDNDILYGKKPQSYLGQYDALVNHLNTYAIWKLLGLNMLSSAFNVTAGITSNLRHIGVRRSALGIKRMLVKFRPNGKFEDGFFQGKALAGIRKLGFVEVSKDTELSMENAALGKFQQVIFAGTSYGEHFNQMMTIFGSMNQEEWDSYDDEWNLKEGHIGLTKDRITHLMNENNWVNGSYHHLSKRGFSKTTMGRLVMSMKGWMPDMYMAHFVKEFTDLNDIQRKGVFSTVGPVGLDLFKSVFTNPTGLKQKWDSLPEVDKDNMHKFMREVIWAGGLSMLAFGAADDKEKKYYVKRLMQDALFVYDIDNYSFNFNAPAPAFKAVVDLCNLMKEIQNVVSGDPSEYLSDSQYHHKGDMKLPALFVKTMPFQNFLHALGK